MGAARIKSSPPPHHLLQAEGGLTSQHSDRTKPHILILTSATGGGHNSCAAALRHAFHTEHGDRIQITIADLWTDYAPWPLNLLPRWYYMVTNRFPFLWIALWNLMKIEGVANVFFGLIGWWVKPQAFAAFQAFKPDAIVAVHPVVQRGVRQAIKWFPSTHPIHAVPWFTIVTDLVSPHPIWFDPDVARCFVPTAEAATIALTQRVPRETLIDVGLPSLQITNHQLLPTLSTILLMGGAEGMGPMSRIAQAIDGHLATSGAQCVRMIIICGTNERLRRQLMNVHWSIPVEILGYVNNIQMWMDASQLLVTKAGPSTITEGINHGLPILLTGYLPGQEKGNVDYIVNNGAGLFCSDPIQIGRTVHRWLVERTEEREAFAEGARQLARPDAAKQVVDEIVACLVAMDGNKS